MDKKSIEKLFNLAKEDILCNTSYPLSPRFFKQYKSSNDIMAKEKNIAVYIHIPFCINLCRFCEYTRFKKGDDVKEYKYLKMLKKQIVNYEETHDIDCLYGLDIGGGTPTSLNYENFEILMEMASDLTKKYNKVKDFESSIEFNISTIDEHKIKLIYHAGFRRVSTGIQVYNKRLLDKNNREFVELKQLKKINELLKEHGIYKLNLDIMYGLPQQTIEMCKDTIDIISLIKPEQVTLYETRYNMNTIFNNTINRKNLFEQYNAIYQRLISMGYKARFGQNTFTKGNDEGVSSYLRYRMNDCIAYKGFGVSAQSMSNIGISYNSLKSSQEIYIPNINEINEQYNYKLPPDEIAAKYVSIALYSSKFSISVLSNIVGNPMLYYKEAFDLLLDGGYIYIDNDFCYLTVKGFMYYGAVAAMFWSKSHQLQYLS